jgi:hypothetical protein
MAIRLATCGWQPPDMADRAMRAIRHRISGYFGALLYYEAKSVPFRDLPPHLKENQQFRTYFRAFLLRPNRAYPIRNRSA